MSPDSDSVTLTPAEPILSRCPNCATLFRVSPEQLHSAQGKVRCGLCMAVFDAHGQQELASAVPPAVTLVEPQPTTTATTLPQSEQRTPARERRTSMPAAPTTDIPVPLITAQTERPLLDRRLARQLQQLRLDEPLPTPTSRSRRPLIYGLLSLLALLLLAAQLAWYRFDQLAVDPLLRPLFDRFCTLSGCSLPPQRDLQALVVQQVAITPDPRRPEVVTVEIILTNQAPFAQPFPAIELTFVDAADQPIAQRRLQPREYLSGELQDRTEMPSATPIHLALPLIRPAQPAQQIKLRLVSP
ncbi:MAG TPA: zinc-ribbon and DUF3426 domain-containing protein [Pseudomonadales bacterium]|nr:zinc-ribbon and DUF3426 domain-containing protein [Pseudomonadales bacterium]